MSESQRHWLGRPRTVRWLWVGFVDVLILTLVPDLFIEQYEHFGLEGGFGFYAWYGFATCTAMVVVAKLLGRLLKRPDDFYDH